MKLVIYGNSDLAELMYYYFTSDSASEVVAFCVQKEYIKSDNFMGKPLIAFEEIETKCPPHNYQMFVAVGYKNMRLRKKLYELTKSKGYTHANYISSKAVLDDSNVIGENNAILHNVVLEPFASIGDNNMINTSTIVCHHAKILDHCFIAANSVVGGYTRVQNNCFIGFSATIFQKLTIEDETLIAAGTLMNMDSKKYSTYKGVPAIYISNHQTNGIEIKG